MCDLAKNTQRPDMPHFRVVALTDNMASFRRTPMMKGTIRFCTSVGSLDSPNDIVIAISASGTPQRPERYRTGKPVRSQNNRVYRIRRRQTASRLPKTAYTYPVNCIEQVEDIHLMLEHLILQRSSSPHNGTSGLFGAIV